MKPGKPYRAVRRRRRNLQAEERDLQVARREWDWILMAEGREPSPSTDARRKHRRSGRQPSDMDRALATACIVAGQQGLPFVVTIDFTRGGIGYMGDTPPWHRRNRPRSVRT